MTFITQAEITKWEVSLSNYLISPITWSFPDRLLIMMHTYRSEISIYTLTTRYLIRLCNRSNDLLNLLYSYFRVREIFNINIIWGMAMSYKNTSRRSMKPVHH